MAGLHHDVALVCRAQGIILGVDVPQPWLTRNGHLHPLVQSSAPAPVLDALGSIFRALGGDERRLARSPGNTPSAPDLLTEQGCVIEIDELINLSSARATTFHHYPSEVELGFDVAGYRLLIEQHRSAADAVLARETTKDFPVPGGRQAQRAYQDALRDLLAPTFTGAPAIRLAIPDQSLTGIARRIQAELDALASRPR